VDDGEVTICIYDLMM